MNDLISIVMPSYNTGKFIEETINSVMAQTYKNWELLIVDDCSTDNTDVVVSTFKDHRIRYFKNECNTGAAISRNLALREAKGRWIAFLDSDDIWLPEKLEKQIAFMKVNKYNFSYTKYSEIDEHSHSLNILVSGPKRITKRRMYNYCWPGCLTVMYNSDVVGLTQIADIKKNNDYAMWLRVCQKTDCYFLDEELARYRKRNGSISRQRIETMIGWHYKLWHEAEKKGQALSMWLTFINLISGFWKKVRFVKRG